MVVHAGREEDDAPVLAGAGLLQAQHAAIEAARGVEIADEERHVTELTNGEPSRGARGCLHDGGSVTLLGHG